MRLTRRSSARAARSAPGVTSATIPSQARANASRSAPALASMARAMMTRDDEGSARAESQERAALARERRSDSGRGCGPAAPSTMRAACITARMTSRGPPNADLAASAASERSGKPAAASAKGGDAGAWEATTQNLVPFQVSWPNTPSLAGATARSAAQRGTAPGAGRHSANAASASTFGTCRFP